MLLLRPVRGWICGLRIFAKDVFPHIVEPHKWYISRKHFEFLTLVLQDCKHVGIITVEVIYGNTFPKIIVIS